MASIDQYLNQIKSSRSGADIRETIISIFDTIDNNGPDAKTLRGKKASEYVSKTELEEFIRNYTTYIKKDDKPDAESENLLMTKGIIKLTGLLGEYPN